MNNFKTMENKKRVVVGLSGGVDSSVAAYLLKEQGYEVIGMFMKNWHDETVTISNECPWMEDSTDAMLVAQKLNIPFQAIDLSEEYKDRIVDYMFAEYEAGRTPNPDILCNREIKFDIFLKAAQKLKDAGLKRINISLDSLNAATAAKIAQKDVLKTVLEGIQAADDAGLKIKINCVPIKGINDKDVIEVLEFCKEKAYVVRFIEFMENHHAKDGAKGLNSDEIKAIIALFARL